MWGEWMEYFNEIKNGENNNNYNFIQVGVMQGWQCPICKRVLAPFVQECPCKGQGIATMTVATTDSKGADNIE
jgi:hypothetical protein